MLTTTPSLSSIASTGPAQLPAGLAGGKTRGDASVENAKALKENFSQFVGETFFGQLLKSMRQTVGEPAYFHGGMAEEQFQAQFDQQLSQDMSSGGANGLAESLFRSQFPDEAALLDAQLSKDAPAVQGLSQLDGLRRR